MINIPVNGFRRQTEIPQRTRPGPELEEEGKQGSLGLQHEQEEPDLQVGEYLPQNLPTIDMSKSGQAFKAGRVSQCIDAWAKITSDYKNLGNLRGYKLEFEEPSYQERPAGELKFGRKEKNILRQEIKKLIEKEVITKVDHVEGEFISNVFLREKKTEGKYRMILNLKHLYKLTETQHFKMETLLTILAMITPGDTFLSFDFSEAYYSIAFCPLQRKYLRFYFDKELYTFTCLPNGLSSAPRFFTEIMKVALAHLQGEHGVLIACYLDDQLTINKGIMDALLKDFCSVDLFQKLGFTINIPKSVI